MVLYRTIDANKRVCINDGNVSRKEDINQSNCQNSVHMCYVKNFGFPGNFSNTTKTRRG